MIQPEELELLESDARCLCGHAHSLHWFDVVEAGCHLDDCPCQGFQSNSWRWPENKPREHQPHLPSTLVGREYSALLTRTLDSMRKQLVKEIHGKP